MHHHVSLLGCTLALLCSAPAVGQVPQLLWDVSVAHSPGTDEGGSIWATVNGGAFVASRTNGLFVVTHHDPDGTVLWTTSFGVNGVNRIWDGLDTDGIGGLFFAGQVEGSGFAGAPIGPLSDGLLVRLDPTGAVLWSRRIGAPSASTSAVDVLHDGAGGTQA